MKRRHLLAASTALLTSPLGMPFLSARADTVGVTDKEIKIGHTIAYSGPASAYGIIGKTHTAFWNQVNDKAAVRPQRIKQRLPPPAEFDFVLAQDRAHPPSAFPHPDNGWHRPRGSNPRDVITATGDCGLSRASYASVYRRHRIATG